MSELNLGAIQLVPFKTKAVTRDGSKAIFIGTDNTPHPYGWALLQTHGTGCLAFGSKHNGLVEEDEHPLDIMRVVPKWEPRMNDVVKVVGIVVVLDDYGGVRDYLRLAATASHEFMIVGCNSPSAGYFKLRVPSSNYTHVAHRDSMRLIRRPS